MYCKVKYSQHSSIIWPVWLSGWQLSVRFQSKWSWVRFQLQSLKQSKYLKHEINLISHNITHIWIYQKSFLHHFFHHHLFLPLLPLGLPHFGTFEEQAVLDSLSLIILSLREQIIFDGLNIVVQSQILIIKIRSVSHQLK